MTLPGQNYSNTFLFLSKNYALKLSITWATNIAPRYRLCLPSCGCGFQSQAHHLRFFNLYNWNCNEKRTKINEKEAGIGPFLKKLFITFWTDHSYCFSLGGGIQTFTFPPKSFTTPTTFCGKTFCVYTKFCSQWHSVFGRLWPLNCKLFQSINNLFVGNSFGAASVTGFGHFL